MRLPYTDRQQAGRALGAALQRFAARADVIVLALPRGGVPVGYEVAQHLHAPLDVLCVRKLGVPGHAELAMGAVASGGVRVLNHEVVGNLRLSTLSLDEVSQRERRELERRERLYRGARPYPSLARKCVILVDDGLATGATMQAAVRAVRQQHAAEVIVAVPAGPSETVGRLACDADEVLCLATPRWFSSVGQWYTHFEQVSDAQVQQLLKAPQSNATGG